MNVQPITDVEFARVRRLIHEAAGISLNDAKKVMVTGRLDHRLSHHRMRSYGEYCNRIVDGSLSGEMQVFVDLLTTNETYFFREPEHFEFLRDEVLPSLRAAPISLWSAACASGEEAYTLAMLMAEHAHGGDWHVLGSDVSQRILERARQGHYPMDRIDGIPPQMLKRYCLKGVRAQAGTLLIGRSLRQHVSFRHINLIEPLPAIGRFHVVFLRNALIYFDAETKADVVRRVASTLHPGGYFITSHTEHLHGIDAGLEMLRPSIFRRSECGHNGRRRRGAGDMRGER